MAFPHVNDCLRAEKQRNSFTAPSEPPRVFRRLVGLSQAARADSLLLTMVRQFQFHRRHVADRFQQPTVIEPVDPFQGCVLDGLQSGATARDDE